MNTITTCPEYFILESLVNSQPRELSQHAHRVALLSAGVAHLYGCNEEITHQIYLGCLLHDIGKQFISSTILHKNTILTRNDVTQLQLHPEFGYRYLSHFMSNGDILNIVLYHHERWNGSGYPYGLKYDEISLGARICAITDVWDALTTDRCYRRAWRPMQACEYIWACAGYHFDRDISFLFLELIERLSSSGSIRDEGVFDTNLKPASRVRILEGVIQPAHLAIAN